MSATTNIARRLLTQARSTGGMVTSPLRVSIDAAVLERLIIEAEEPTEGHVLLPSEPTEAMIERMAQEGASYHVNVFCDEMDEDARDHEFCEQLRFYRGVAQNMVQGLKAMQSALKANRIEGK